MNEQIITFTLKTTSALHIGGSGGDEVTDDLLRRNAQGGLFIPGSAIAGPLRAIATRLAPRLGSPICQALRPGRHFSIPCGCWVCHLFGEINPQEETSGALGGSASALWVCDASLSGVPMVRDGVGIDRISGAAARQGAVKFDLETLPAGKPIQIRLRLRRTTDAGIQQQNEMLLAAILAEWQGGRGILGGRSARGLGAFGVCDDSGIRWHQRSVESAEQLMTFLRRKKDDFLVATIPDEDGQERRLQAARALPLRPSPEAERSQCLTSYGVARAWAEAALTLHFNGPMLINDIVQAQRSGFDHAPFGLTVDPTVGWVLPGSGIRGVLRSQAERIARTLATQDAWQDSQPQEYFLHHCPAGDPNNSRRPNDPLANSDALLREAEIRGDVAIVPQQLDLGDRLFGSVRMGSRLTVSDGILANRPTLKPLDFLAIDRFTGGGRASAKFDAIALWQPAFTVRLRLENPEAWELGWLLLTLQDLHDGLTSIGFGAAKGFGQACITEWSARLGFLQDADFPSADAPEAVGLLEQASTATDGVWRVVAAAKADPDHKSIWLPMAEAWVMAFTQEVSNFKRVSDAEAKEGKGVPYQKQDSYFGRVEHLYPVEAITHG